MTDTISGKLASLGCLMPTAATPVANYVPAVRSGALLFVSGQISQVDGAPAFVGHIGAELSLDEGRKAAELAALGVIAQIATAADDRLGSIRRIVRLGVFVACAPEFIEHPQVANGASDLLVAVFGDAGRHARAAVGVASLPRGASVEIDAVVEFAG
jgi:enamine deaminase RidA (YjgF/YER057c/UK114 family)